MPTARKLSIGIENIFSAINTVCSAGNRLYIPYDFFSSYNTLAVGPTISRSILEKMSGTVISKSRALLKKCPTVIGKKKIGHKIYTLPNRQNTRNLILIKINFKS